MTTNLLSSLQDPEYSIDFQIVDSTQLKPTKVALSCVNMLKNSLEIANLMPESNDKNTYKLQIVKRLTFSILKVYVSKFEELCNDYMKNEGKFFNLITLPFNNNKSNKNNSGKSNALNSHISDNGNNNNSSNDDDDNNEGSAKKTDNSNDSDYEDIPVNEYLESLMKLHNSTKYVSDKLKTYNKTYLFKKLFKIAIQVNENGEYDDMIYEKTFSFSGEKFQNNGFFDNFIKKLDGITDELTSLININLKNCLKEGLKSYLDINWNSKFIEEEEEEAWGFNEDEELRNKVIESTQNNKEDYYFGKITSFQELIKFGLSEKIINDTVINNSGISKFTISTELREILKLISQLKYIKRCIGTKGINFYKFQITFLNHVSKILQNYIFKINKFYKVEAARQIKLDILKIYKRVLQLNTINLNRDDEINCYTPFKLVENQTSFMKLMEICNVLMTDEETLKHYLYIGKSSTAVSSFISDFNKFRNAEDFSKMKQFLNLKCLLDSDIYDLISRIVLV